MTKKSINEDQLQLDDYGYEGSLAAKACIQKIIGRTAQIEFTPGMVLENNQHYLIVTVKFARQPICYFASKLQKSDLDTLEKGEKKKRSTFISDHQRMTETRFYKALSEWVEIRCAVDYPDLPYQYEYSQKPFAIDV